MKILPLLILVFLSVCSVFAQKKNEAYQYHLQKATSALKIDGVLDEKAWLDAETAGSFFMVQPIDTSLAKVRTEVRMTYDDHNLYLIAVCYQAMPGKNVVESLRRDFSFNKNDNFLLFMDPFDDQTNGFTFGANAAGAQWDGLLFEGGSSNLNWDNKWTSVVRNDAEKWVFEAAIPFKTIRYKKGITRWGINFGRLDLKANEKSSWAPVPRQFPTASLAYTGTLVWDAPPPSAGVNVSVIPYALGGVTRNYDANRPNDFRGDFGADAKIAVTSSLNLDLTVNPDFSQVEVDRQVTNLDRFELFFPERRQFFLENGDLFTNFGYGTVRPFFSRRIGLGVPIRFGARLSGKLNKDWRIGLLDMQTGQVEERGLPAQNFAVMSLQRRVFARSNIGAIFINKESMNYAPEVGKPSYSAYNRNLGFEYNLASSNNLWTGKALYLKSFSPGKSGEDAVFAGNLLYSDQKWTFGGRAEFVGRRYNAEVGYVPRRGYLQVSPRAGRLFYTKASKNLISHGPTVINTVFYNTQMRPTDNETILGYGFNFRNRSTLVTSVAHNFVRLLQGFDPTNSGRDTLARGTQHRWNAVGFDYVSKPQSPFTFAVSTRYGGYYAAGTRLNLTTEVGYRFQPYVSLLLSSSYNDIRLPKPWNRTAFWLIGPRVDVTLTNTLFFVAFMQYNDQQKNVNLNTRLQWRYKPASDLYIVYTDNYLPENFSVKNRALVVKLTYWWNL